MAYWYMDTDAADDLGTGVDWANAIKVLETGLALMAAGDTLFVQGAATDTSAITRTLSSAGVEGSSCRVIGVVDGTTNEGASIVSADLAVTLPLIETTSIGVISHASYTEYYNIHFMSTAADMTMSSNYDRSFTNCKLSFGVEMNINIASQNDFVNCTFEPLTTSDTIRGSGGTATFKNCTWLFTGGAYIFRSSTTGRYNFYGCDLSAIPVSGGVNSGACTAITTLSNCKMPSTAWELSGSVGRDGRITAIGCTDDVTRVIDSSIQTYRHMSPYGNIDSDIVQVRTGGADDGATGAFSYAMTPKADSTLEGSFNNLKSPQMAVWLSGGSHTLTIYFANDGGVDYNEDEIWVEWFTPSSTDSAKHDFAVDVNRILTSSIPHTDDVSSAWGGTAANGQSISTTVTTGFEGFAYATLHVAKRSATPDTVFLDPKIVIS